MDDPIKTRQDGRFAGDPGPDLGGVAEQPQEPVCRRGQGHRHHDALARGRSGRAAAAAGDPRGAAAAAGGAEANDPLGRAPGAPLCPELGKDAAWLRDFKRAYLDDPKGGARAWAALYQCAPRVEGGNLIRPELVEALRSGDARPSGPR